MNQRKFFELIKKFSKTPKIFFFQLQMYFQCHLYKLMWNKFFIYTFAWIFWDFDEKI